MLAYAGYFLGRSFRDIDKYLGPVTTVFVVVAVVAYLWRLATWKPKGGASSSEG